MSIESAARAMRARGNAFAKIAENLGITLQHAYRCASDVVPNPVTPTGRTVVRHGAHNGGCSTMSGLMPVSLPRITAIDGVA